MSEFVCIKIFPVALTLLAFFAAQRLQQKLKSPLLNPIVVSVLIVICVIFATGLPIRVYKTNMDALAWLLTPATVSLAVPMYGQFQQLKKNLPAIAAGVAGGAVSCLVLVLALCAVFGFSRILTLSLLPKSITTAIGVVLSEMAGGMPGITTAAIIFTGIFANILGPVFCRLFRITDPIAQGVAFGTSGHVIGTAKANELSPLTGAVSSLSLVVAGLITAVVLPLLVNYI